MAINIDILCLIKKKWYKNLTNKIYRVYFLQNQVLKSFVVSECSSRVSLKSPRILSRLTCF